MKIQDVLDMTFATNYNITRPALHERSSYLRYQGEKLPLKLCRFDSLLQTDWSPSVEELLAEDWQIIKEEQ